MAEGLRPAGKWRKRRGSGDSDGHTGGAEQGMPRRRRRAVEVGFTEDGGETRTQGSWQEARLAETATREAAAIVVVGSSRGVGSTQVRGDVS